jgi:hypothetical protein
LPVATRLQKTLSKGHSNGLGQLKRADGSYTDNMEETHKILMKVHFPGSVVDHQTPAPAVEYKRDSRAYSLSGKLFTADKVKWAVDKFGPFKSPGPDRIFPALIQKSLEIIGPYLGAIFRASYSFGYIRTPWRKVRVVYIPKGGERPADDPKAYRPISLSSFFLKIMERLLNVHIRGNLSEPLHVEQYAYQSGRSTEDALHRLVTKIEKTIK